MTRETRSFAQLLRSIRESFGRTVTDFARETRIPRRTLTRWEAGRTKPSLEQGLRLVVALERRDRALATRVAAALGHDLDALWPAEHTPAAALRRGVDAASAELDISGARVRAALAAAVAQWRRGGLTLEEVARRLAPK